MWLGASMGGGVLVCSSVSVGWLVWPHISVGMASVSQCIQRAGWCVPMYHGVADASMGVAGVFQCVHGVTNVSIGLTGVFQCIIEVANVSQCIHGGGQCIPIYPNVSMGVTDVSHCVYGDGCILYPEATIPHRGEISFWIFLTAYYRPSRWGFC